MRAPWLLVAALCALHLATAIRDTSIVDVTLDEPIGRRCCTNAECKECFETQLASNPACGLDAPWCGCTTHSCEEGADVSAWDPAANRRHHHHEEDPEDEPEDDGLACCSIMDCTKCFNVQVSEHFGCGMKSLWCGCHLEDCSSRGHPGRTDMDAGTVEYHLAENRHHHHKEEEPSGEEEEPSEEEDDDLKCCTVSECTKCFKDQVALDSSCGFKKLWCGCHKEDCSAEGTAWPGVVFLEGESLQEPDFAEDYATELRRHKRDRHPEDPLACCSVKECTTCFNREVNKHHWCGLKKLWCGCHKIKC